MHLLFLGNPFPGNPFPGNPFPEHPTPASRGVLEKYDHLRSFDWFSCWR